MFSITVIRNGGFRGAHHGFDLGGSIIGGGGGIGAMHHVNIRPARRHALLFS
jgi:hypothetical protein